MTANGQTDVVFTFNSATWGDAQERQMCFSEDRLLGRLWARPDVRRLLVVEGLRSVPLRLARRLLGGRPPFPARAGTSLYSPGRLRRKDPRSPEALERHYRRYDARLAAQVRRAGLERPPVITSNPFIAAFCPLEWAREVVFYGWDDWAAHPSTSPWWPSYERAYRAIRMRGCEVWAVSQAIVDRIDPLGPARVVPNGVEPGEWASPSPPPSWFRSLPGPRILYTGTLDRRVDVASVKRIAEALGGASVVLVGSVVDPGHFAPVAELPNVRLPGEVPRDAIPSLVSAADACVIPHTRGRLTEAMSPLKLYEYLAAGRPVAATDLPPIRDVDDRVILVGEGGDFAEAVRRSLQLGPAEEPRRQAFLAEHSWDARHEPLLDALLAAETHKKLPA